MIETLPVLNTIGMVIYWIAQIVLLGACIWLVSKNRSTGGVILLVAVLLSLLFSVGSFFINIIAVNMDTDMLITFYGVNNIMNGLSHALFVFGFILLIQEMVKLIPKK